MENETPLTTEELLALLASARVVDGAVRLPASEGTVTPTSYPLYF